MTGRDAALIAVFAALTAALGLMPPIPVLPFIPVPVTLQTLGVMLAGLLLGPRRGALSMALLVLLVVAGIPALSGGRGGIGVLLSPTGGFLLGWIPGAFLTGLLARRLGPSRPGLFVAVVLGGIGGVYLIGVPWLSLVSGLPPHKALWSIAAFLPGDLLKALLAVGIGDYVRRALPTLGDQQPEARP